MMGIITLPEARLVGPIPYPISGLRVLVLAVLRENLIRLAVVDFFTSALRPWDHELMAPSSLPCPHWYGSFERLLGG